MRISREYNLSFLVLLLLIFFGFFTLGCTGGNREIREKKIELRQNLGVIVRNVSYSKNIVEGSTLDVILRIENVGDSNASNVRIYLEGLSTKWRPPTPLEKTIVSLPRKERLSLEYSSTSPILGENISYPMIFRVEYDYKTIYNLVLEVIKEDKDVKISIKSQSNSISPLMFNITDYRYESVSNRLKIKLSLTNREVGRVIGDVLVIPEDMICDTTRLSFTQDQKIASRELNCDIILPKDFSSYYPQVRVGAIFRYSYRTPEYLIRVVKS